MAKTEQETPECLYIVALDFGTKFSAFGFSSNVDFEKDPLKIKTSLWSTGAHLSHKTPTTLLLNPDKTEVSFGSNAEKKFQQLSKKSKDQAKKYYYFDRFTEKIKEVTSSTNATDANGKQLPLADVIGFCLKLLKEELFQRFKFQEKDKHNSHYFVTLPASWETKHSLKPFIKQLASKAEIERTHLSLLTQDEAADAFFKHNSKDGKAKIDPMLEKKQEEKDYKDGGDFVVLKGAVLLGHAKTPVPKVVIVEKKLSTEVVSLEQQIKQAEKTIKIEPEKVKQIQKSIQKKYNYFEEGPVEITPEILEKGLETNTQSKLCFKEVATDKIEQDTKDISKMVFDAKRGSWNDVWNILERKPYIVNCIPEERAWSALHQAIFQDNFPAVQKLVEEFGADTSVFTKPDAANVTEAGTNAIALAQQLGKLNIFEYLLTQTILKKAVIKSQDISYFAVHKNGTVYPFQKYPLFQITLASYTSIFSRDQSLLGQKMAHMSKITHDIILHSDEIWQDAKIRIRNTLYGIDRGHSEYLLNASCKQDFFQKLIRLYTEESVYHFLTPALLRQPHTPYKPVATDLAVAPFALTLSAVLMHWKELEPFYGVTYRGVGSDVTNQYKVGQTLIFLSFISTSKLRPVAEKFAKDEGTMFIFHNSANEKWRPRSIKNYSRYPYEEECLYPLGVEFSVYSVSKKSREVILTLLDSTV